MPTVPRINAAVIVVHETAHALAALAAAAALRQPVALLSPPGAAAFMGAAYFQAMIAQASRRHPGAEVTAVLDCGARAGDALAALRQGIEAVCFLGSPEVTGRLRDIARQRAATVIGARPEALDLAGVVDAESACRAWLTGWAGADNSRPSLQ